MTPEGKVKQQIRRVLVKHKAYYNMPMHNGMGAPTLDYIGCHNGFFFGIEAKAPGKHPTIRQEQTIKAMTDAGAVVFVIDGNTEGLEEWLKTNASSR